MDFSHTAFGSEIVEINLNDISILPACELRVHMEANCNDLASQ